MQIFITVGYIKSRIIKTINIEKGLFVPNVFCPTHSNPELNKFTTKAIGLEEYHIQVFDTYGNLIWESRGIEDGVPSEWWDGTLNGNVLMQDVYVWKVYAVFKDDDVWDGKKYMDKKVLKKTGTVTLLR